MTARAGSTTCCDFCPRAHTRECLARHSTEVCSSARQHVAAHRARRSGCDGGVKRDSEVKREERASDGDAVMSEETSRLDRRAAVARARAETEDNRRTNEVDDVANRLHHHAPFLPSVNEDVSMKARRRARESVKANARAVSGRGARPSFLGEGCEARARVVDSDRRRASDRSAGGHAGHMPVARR